jgi:hypothetical protein
MRVGQIVDNDADHSELNAPRKSENW